jgi:hypothetical protein
MTSYEPKSGGHEVSGLTVAAVANGVSDVSSATELAIRFWGLHVAETSGRLTWETDSVCVYMIADLVSASGGRTDEANGIMAAHFETAAQALVAAKRIQTSMLEFVAERKGDAIGVALLIYPPSTTPGGTHIEIVRGVLAHARPGQILLSDAVARPWSDFPGFQFRAALIVEGSANRQPGLMELMWTNAEELSRLQDSVVDQPAAPDGGLSMGATMMVNSPSAVTQHVGRGFAGDSAFREIASRTAQRETVSPQTGARSLPMADRSGANALLEGLDDYPKHSFFTPMRVILGAAAIILVAVAVDVLYTPAPVKKIPVVMPDAYNGGTSASGSSAVSATPTASQPASTPGQPTSNPAVSESPVTSQNPIVNPPKPKPFKVQGNSSKGPSDKDAKNPTSPQPAPVDEIDGWSKKDIPVLLSRANSAIGDGRYEDAQNAYSKILQLQPDNQAARDGLRKIELIKRDNNP